MITNLIRRVLLPWFVLDQTAEALAVLTVRVLAAEQEARDAKALARELYVTPRETT